MSTIPLIKEKVFSADLPADMKMYLLNFLLFGDTEIEDIINEFRKAETFCRELHKIHSDEKEQLISFYETNIVEALSKKCVLDISSYDKVYYTFSLMLSEIISCHTYRKHILTVLGISEAKKIESSFNKLSDFDVNLYELGRILYDETRLRILNMLQQEDMYCAQIAKILGLRNNSTLYHLNMMEREGLIKHIGTGKKKYYCINQSYLNQIKKLIDNKFTREASHE